MARHVVIFVVISSLCFLVYGLILRGIALENGAECDMTWSSQGFILLPDHSATADGASLDLPYSLVKFKDQRDTRHNHLIDHDRPPVGGSGGHTFHCLPNVNWCQTGNPDAENVNAPGHRVLYIPGHEGQYAQGRSLGAHGINLSRHSRDVPQSQVSSILGKLRNGQMTSNAHDLDDFVFDVYMVDFDGEGGGLHGSRLFAQAKYVAQAIERIVDECDGSDDAGNSVTVVAHSIGGLVARMAILEVNQNRKEPFVQNLITLASPHESIPFAIDQSVHKFHRYLVKREKEETSKELDNKRNLVSISGGLRDELIPPDSCYGGNDHAITFTISDVMHPRVETNYTGNKFGMDHKAIVWCNGALSVVRELIHVMVTSSFNQKDSIESVSRFLDQKRMSLKLPSSNECDFRCETLQKDDLLKRSWGFFASLAMKTAKLYNCRALAMLYLMNGVIYLSAVWASDKICKSSMSLSNECCFLIIPWVSSILVYSYKKEEFIKRESIVILAFIAMELYYAILFGIFPAASWLTNHMVPRLSKQNAAVEAHESKSRSRIQSTRMGRVLKQQVRWVVFLYIIAAQVMFAFSAMKNKTLVRNNTSLGAHTFLIGTSLIIMNIVHLGSHSSPKKSECCSVYPQKVSALLLIIFPLFTFSKIVYALSLFTQEGQTKTQPFVQFEQDQWSEMCDRGKEQRFICAAGIFMKHDLMRCTVVVCCPMYILLLWLGCHTGVIPQESDEDEFKKDS